MKYNKPELTIVKIETEPIASAGLEGWLNNTYYKDAKNYITDFYISNS